MKRDLYGSPWCSLPRQVDSEGGEFIWRLSEDLEDGYVAASDSRRDGAAVGF